jgi:uncharacterized protein (DUF488 family)
MPATIFTIGHSGHPIGRFISLLEVHGVTALADVRSAPFSRRHPQFNRNSLSRSLRDAGIDYVFLGKELGARTGDRSCYEGGRVVYARLAATALFRSGIERVKNGAAAHRIALMCAEKEPLDCHRTLLIARVLEREGEPVSHIHDDGGLEPNRDAMRRLLEITGVPREDLFRSEADLVEEACLRQEQKVAYVDEALSVKS